MIRSLHYAVHKGLRSMADKVHGDERLVQLERFAEHWFQWTSSAFLRAYLRKADQSAFLPKTREELLGLFNVYLLEKAVYELDYELNNRPDWVILPLKGIEWLVQHAGGPGSGGAPAGGEPPHGGTSGSEPPRGGGTGPATGEHQ